MANLEVVQPPLTGKLSFKHKTMLNAFALFLEWAAGRLRNIETYEEAQEFAEEAEKKTDALEAEFREDIKTLGN